MAKNKRQRAKKMAARGASAAKIERKTGVSSQAASRFVSRAAAPQSPAQSMQIYQQSNGDRITTQAPPRPSNIQPSYVDAGSGRSFNTRFVPGVMSPGQKGYDPATGGGVWVAGSMSDEDLRAWYRSADPTNTAGNLAVAQSGKDASAFTLEGLYGEAGGQAGAQSSTPNPTGRRRKIKGVRQGLRIAGAGGISGSDLRDIRKATGKSNEQLIRKLDKINKNLRSKDKVGISLNSGALNSILKKATQKQGKPRTYGFMPDFGTGRIGQDIMSRMGDPGSAGRYVKGQLVGARDAAEPRFLAGGMQIRPGGRERVRGFGKQYELPERFKPKDEVVDGGEDNNGDGNGATGGDDTTSTTTPVIPEPEPVDTSLSSGLGGLDLASWATGFRRARSSRQRAGRRAQGTGSMKNLKFKQQFS